VFAFPFVRDRVQLLTLDLGHYADQKVKALQRRNVALSVPRIELRALHAL